MAWIDGLKGILLQGLTLRQQREVVVSLMICVLVFHILWVCGFIPGVEGFVPRSEAREIARKEVESLEARIDQRIDRSTSELKVEFQNATNEISAIILASQMEELQANKCAATDPEIRRIYDERINIKKAQYREVKGFFYQLAPCTGT